MLSVATAHTPYLLIIAKPRSSQKPRMEPEVVARYVTLEARVIIIIPSFLKAVNPATMSVRPTPRSYRLMSGKYPEGLKHT
jgi:hypothetical protein